MERLYITHYYYPGTDPWKNNILTAENNNYKENKTSQTHISGICYKTRIPTENKKTYINLD